MTARTVQGSAQRIVASSVFTSCYMHSVFKHGQNQLSKCENEKCTLRFNVHGMEKHLKECPFGVIDCPMDYFDKGSNITILLQEQ
ncbi:hypothetical protein MSG28_005758 [Choristoneura fumiferana]|uniref:Uncharacterized protein n=1 Tax=Choristoneura fumiferana TaxID=7141 RepID=A0ACC0L0K1_CHOFU|nr:hypothetical protein MSG28_005758 [Choristoneura fumiferana]